MTFAALHDSPWRGVFYTTGGTLLLSDLLTESGASDTVLLATIPYAHNALTEILRTQPDQACSAATAELLAREAWFKAQSLAPTHKELFGFAVTTNLRTNRPKRGGHRAFMALHTQTKTWTWSLHLKKNQRSRLGEERLVANISGENLRAALGLATRSNASNEHVSGAPEDLNALMQGRSETCGKPGDVFLPGSFNPLHDGHKRMKDVVEAKLGKPAQYEMCIQNVDKPSLDYIDVEQRRTQFKSHELILTREPKFLGKARVLTNDHGCTFVVGADTFKRIVDPNYYSESSIVERDAALNEIKDLGCSFLVFGRTIGGDFVSLSQLEVPSILTDVVEGVNEAEFRVDLSSTSIREQDSRKI